MESFLAALPKLAFPSLLALTHSFEGLLAMLRITRIAHPNAVTLKLEGSVREPWVAELLHACEGEARLALDLSDVQYVDASGEVALRELLERRGVTVGACSTFVAELLHLVKP